MMEDDNIFKQARRQFLLKGQYPYLCAALLCLIGLWTILNNLNMPSLILYGFLILWLLGFTTYVIGFFSLNAISFSSFYFIFLIAILSLVVFLVGLLSQSPILIANGLALGINPTFGWPLAIAGISLSVYVLYRRFCTIDYTYYFKQTFAAKNYDLEHNLYFINQFKKEPSLSWKFFDAPGKSGLSKLEIFVGILAALLPFGTGAAYITIMSEYNSFTINRIAFFFSLPAFLFFGFISLLFYVRYRSYKRIQQELNASLKPALKI